MKEDLSEYLGLPVKASEFTSVLRERKFVKTHIDIAYSDLNNWERKGILYFHPDAEKGKRKALSYIEYAWVKVVDCLRSYGFSINEIIALKDDFFPIVSKEDLLKNALDNIEELKKVSPESAKLIFENKDNKELWDSIEIEQPITLFETLIMNVILNKDETIILFYKGIPTDYSVYSKRILEVADKKGSLDELVKKNKRTHLAVNLTHVLSKFLNEEGDVDSDKQIIVSENEYQLLTQIRKRSDSLTSIEVKYEKGEAVMLLMSEFKRVEMESKLIDHIQKGEYKEMVINTQDGNITSFKNTTRIKLK